jgi:hypothetical protein
MSQHNPNPHQLYAPLAPGHLVAHPTWGLGRVVTVEGSGGTAQAKIEFISMRVWVVIANTPVAIIDESLEEE